MIGLIDRWRKRRLAQCYREAIDCLVCTMRAMEGPPPPGKTWKVEMWIDQHLAGCEAELQNDEEAKNTQTSGDPWQIVSLKVAGPVLG